MGSSYGISYRECDYSKCFNRGRISSPRKEIVYISNPKGIRAAFRIIIWRCLF